MNLVLTIGAGYADRTFERYLASLRRTGCNARVAIAVPQSEVRGSLEELCRRYGAELAAYPATDLIPVSVRFLVFAELLRALYDSIRDGWVLHTDLRDVVFQNDPFAHPACSEAGLLFALEDGTIGECPFNTEWLRSGFGSAVLQSLARSPITCAGTTLGRTESFREYVNRMNSLIFERSVEGAIRAVRNDQGVHNYLFHCQALADLGVRGLDNSSGLFFTLGLSREYFVDDRAIIRTREGVTPAVVHQIDRIPSETLAQMSRVLPFDIWDLVEHRVTHEVMEKMRREQGDPSIRNREPS